MNKFFLNSFERKSRLTLVLIAYSIFAGMLAYFYFISEKNDILNETHRELSVIELMRSSQISQWYLDETNDAEVLALNMVLVNAYDSWYKNKNSRSLELLKEKLRFVSKEHDYFQIKFLSPDGKSQVSFLKDDSSHAELNATIKKCMESKKLEVSSLYSSPSDSIIHMDLVAPVIDKNKKTIALMVLEKDAGAIFRQIINNWPVFQSSGRTRIVFLKGEELFGIGFESSKIFFKKIDKKSNYPGLALLRNETGYFEGKNIFDKKIIALVSEIKNTPWYQVNQIEYNEVFQRVKKTIILTALIWILSCVLFFAVLFSLYNDRKNKIYLALLEAQKMFETTLYSIGDGVIVIDNNLKIKLINAEAENLTGWSERSAKNKKLDEVFILTSEELSAEKLKTTKEQIGVSGVTKKYRWLISKNGKKIPIDFKVSSLQNNTNAFAGTVIVFRDKTEEYEAEKALSDSEEKYRVIFENINDVYYESTLDGIILEVSPSVERFTSFKREDLIGEHVSKIYADISNRNDVMNVLQKNGFISDFEILINHSDGKKDVCSLSAILYKNENGEPEKISGTLRLITDRKIAEESLRKSEEHFRIIFEASPYAVVLSLLETGIFTNVNRAFEKLSGFLKEEAIGKSSIDLDVWLHNSERDAFVHNVMHHGSVDQLEMKYKVRSGKIINTKVTARIIEIAGVRYLLTIIEDVSEKKLLEYFARKEEEISKLLYDLYNKSLNISDRELFDFTLERTVELSDSKIGFFHQISEDQEHIILTTWNNEALKNCTAVFDNHYPISQAGNWVDCLRERKPIVYNDYFSSPNQKGLPEGHAKIKNFMSVPTYLFGKARLIFGVGNKEENYTDFDAQNLELIANELTKILERRETEKALKISEQNYRELFNSTTDAIFVHDAETENIIDVNDAMLKMYGYENKEEVISSEFYKASNINEDFNEQTARELISKTIKDGPQYFDWQTRKKDGTLFWISMVLKLTNIGGKDCILAVGRDVTERKLAEEDVRRSEEKYRYLFMNNPIPMWIYDNKTLSFLAVNDFAVDHYGYSKEEFLSMTIRDIRPNEDLDYLEHVLKSSSGQIRKVANVRHSKKDGSIIDVEITAHPIEFEKHEAMLVISFDISELKKIESELEKHKSHLEELVKNRTEELDVTNKELIHEVELKNEAEKRLEISLAKEKELSELKSRFISTASHEFRTPLTTVLSSAQLIEKYFDRWNKEKIFEYLEKITNSTNSLTKLMDDVISINRAEAGKLSLNPVKVNLKKMCQRIIEGSQLHLTESHGLSFIYKPNGDEFLADEKQVELIIQNLISNAIKYSPNGGKIGLTIDYVDGNINIIVIDEGLGIPQEDIPKLFEPFHRSKNVEDIQGTGLGLSIVKHAVDLYNGTIKVESVLGKGTKFIVSLPVPN